MSKKVVVISTCNNTISELAYDELGMNIDDGVEYIIEDESTFIPDNEGEVLAKLYGEGNIIPKGFTDNTRILELPDGYDVISLYNNELERQEGIVIGKDMRYIYVGNINKNTSLPEDEEEKLKEFIIPFKFEK